MRDSKLSAAGYLVIITIVLLVVYIVGSLIYWIW
jgi:hypothetical protein